MRQCHYQLVIFTYVSCFGFNINPSLATNYQRTLSPLLFAQADSSSRISFSNLGIGSAGEDVKKLQTQLKKIGYYDGIIDGQFGISTRNAVNQFQLDKGLLTDGIAGRQTRELLAAEIAKQSSVISIPTPAPVSELSADKEKAKQKSSPGGLIQFGLIALGILSGVGILFYIFQRLRNSHKLDDTEIVQPPEDKYETDNQEPEYIKDGDKDADLVKPSLQESHNPDKEQQNLVNNSLDDAASTIKASSKLLPVAKTSHLAKINVVDQLIADLESTNPTQRSKAIWELGQKGDSRAIEPLVEHMIDADSQQRSLILAALSEIGTRTLKPMNHALAVSMQDDSPEVRKNAIRDLTRVYDIMAHISQMLSTAIDDEDPEVQQTAKYAISQMNRISILPSQEPQTQIQYSNDSQDNQ